jgi:beta-mannanase
MNTGGSLRSGASGAYDEHFRGLARQLLADGQPRALLRLGWEFNGGWYKWSATRDPQAFADYFRRIVNVMRPIAPNLRYVWNPGAGPGFVPLQAWPGASYVDVVGIDVYDRNFSAHTRDPVARWNHLMNKPFGLGWARDWARAHGKPLAIPEWALSEKTRHGEQRDNPHFIRSVAAYTRSYPTLFHLYFNVRNHEGDFRITSYPQAARAFRESF